jgi:hypothetical protein
MSDKKFTAAREKLLKRIETEGYRPLAKTLEKYGITQAEAKGVPEPKKRKRDPEVMRRYSQECYHRHRDTYQVKNILYKIANGYRVCPETLMKHNLPTDLDALHPMVLNRKKLGNQYGRALEQPTLHRDEVHTGSP